MQSLGEIELHAPAVGAKIGVFLYVTLGLPARGGHSSNKYYVMVYRSILMPFLAIFSEGIALSDALHGSHLCRQVAPQFSRNCRQKLRKLKKSGEKIVCTTSYDGTDPI